MSDDQFTYYRKMAREYGISLSGWSTISNYTCEIGGKRNPLCAYTFGVSIENFHPIEDLASLKYRFPISVLMRDQTYSSRGLGELPEAINEKDFVIMICIMLHWKDDSRPLKQICLVDVETAPYSDWITIVYIQLGFNDLQYDWPFIMEKANKLHLIEWMWKQMSGRTRQATTKDIIQWNYYRRLEDVTTSNETFSIKENTEEEVKEEFRRDSIFIKVTLEDTFKSFFLKISGCIPIDVRACFKKLYSHSETEKESLLKFYLELCGLKSKADMSFNRLWNYYSETKKLSSDITARNMCEVANYCIIDALHCQELVVKCNVINDYREVASIAHISFFDSHYHANGMKVRNLLGAYAFKHDMVFSTRVCKNIEKGKYSDAYVFPSKKGIETKRPVIGLDFASLYPSLIMAYNLSPEKIILNKEEANIVQKNENNLHKIKFLFNDHTLRAWSVRHDNCLKKKGLYPIILEDLFNKRVKLKAKVTLLCKEKEHLEKLISTIERKGKIVSDTLKSKYASLCFDYNCLNSKQFALKVYMNTFYSKAGNSKSSFFLRELAGGIT
ncbi:11662_t:CDS:2 [Cetraspora pellucida]|uniref:11662_t:CDS:1 n=1 Tax=Cetraspora pellucida TaxID=1433469 RepID=A0ACA9MXX4_9GLOM|nr:11662_t:CDS:2 [Cetraspora pellucida]